MTAYIHLLEELQTLDDTIRKQRVGELLQECPDHILERIRVMFTDAQLMGMELARKAEFFEYLSKETARVFQKEGTSERFNELAEAHLKTLKALSGDIPILNDDPLAHLFFEALILQTFRPPEPAIYQCTT